LRDVNDLLPIVLLSTGSGLANMCVSGAPPRREPGLPEVRENGRPVPCVAGAAVEAFSSRGEVRCERPRRFARDLGPDAVAGGDGFDAAGASRPADCR
jgi:hypothetical protein